MRTTGAEHGDRFVPRSISAALSVIVVGSLLAGCGWGGDRSDGTSGVAASDTAPVLRYVAAPRASVPAAVPDPRCRAARRLFLRAAVTSSPRPFVVDAETERYLDQVDVLADGDAQDDLDAIRDLVERFRSAPRELTGRELGSSVERLDRLLIWTVVACPPPQRPVWGCAMQLDHASGDPLAAAFSGAAGKLVPSEAVEDVVGDVSGDRVELARSANRVVYGWVDGLGLVRRRVEVRRVDDLWFVTDSKRCDDSAERPHPLDTSDVIVEELPDGADGPEWEPQMPEPEPEAEEAEDSDATDVTMSPTVPLTPCGWNPNDPDREFTTLGEYMAHGPAENGCWSLLSPAGRACVSDPPSGGEFFACFDL